MLLLMTDILHQLIGGFYCYLKGFFVSILNISIYIYVVYINI